MSGTRCPTASMASTLSRRGSRSGRGDFRRGCDLLDDFHDVAVRVEDAQLAVGAVPAREDLVDAFQLAFIPYLARMLLDLLHRPANQLRDRHAVATTGRQIHHGSLEPVPRREPLVLRREDAVVRRNLLAALVQLAVVLDERLAVRRQRDNVLEPCRRVTDPDFDRAEPRMEADVPPDVRVVRDATGPLQLSDDRCVVRIVLEAGG